MEEDQMQDTNDVGTNQPMTPQGAETIDTDNGYTSDDAPEVKSSMPVGNTKLPVEKSALDNDDHTKTADFIERLSTGGASLGLPPAAKEKMNSYLLDIRKKYANASLRASHLSPNSPEYQKHAITMNEVNSSIQTLAAQVDAYKANQVDYIKDFDNDSLSHADKVNGKASAMSKLYRGDLEMNIGDDGTLQFGEEGRFVPYSAIATHSVKQYGLADKMLKLTNDMYKTGAPLSRDRKALIINQIKSMVGQAGGRDAVISLMSDGLIPGFEDMEVPENLYSPENYPQLQQYFLDHIGAGIEGAAHAGYADKLAVENARHGRSLDFGLQKLQQTYDFRQSHPTAHGTGSRGGSVSTGGAKTPKGYTAASTVGEAWKILENTPGKKITMPGGATYMSSKEKDAQGRYPITIQGNNNRVDYNTFKKHS